MVMEDNRVPCDPRRGDNEQVVKQTQPTVGREVNSAVVVQQHNDDGPQYSQRFPKMKYDRRLRIS
jgi:hypothetical protein